MRLVRDEVPSGSSDGSSCLEMAHSASFRLLELLHKVSHAVYRARDHDVVFCAREYLEDELPDMLNHLICQRVDDFSHILGA